MGSTHRKSDPLTYLVRVWGQLRYVHVDHLWRSIVILLMSKLMLILREKPTEFRNSGLTRCWASSEDFTGGSSFIQSPGDVDSFRRSWASRRIFKVLSSTCWASGYVIMFTNLNTADKEDSKGQDKSELKVKNAYLAECHADDLKSVWEQWGEPVQRKKLSIDRCTLLKMKTNCWKRD